MPRGKMWTVGGEMGRRLRRRRVGWGFVGFSDDAVVKHLVAHGYASLFDRVGGGERAPVTHLTHRNEEVGGGKEDIRGGGCRV